MFRKKNYEAVCFSVIFLIISGIIALVFKFDFINHNSLVGAFLLAFVITTIVIACCKFLAPALFNLKYNIPFVSGDDKQTILKSSLDSTKNVNVAVVDLDYKYLEFNLFHQQMMKELYGKDIDNNLSILDCISNIMVRSEEEESYNRAFAGEINSNIQNLGGNFYETTYYPLLNKKKEIRGATSISINITPRILAKNAFSESEERYKRITSGLTDYMYTVKVKEGKAIETIQNDSCQLITGYSVEDFKSDPDLWINMVLPDEREWVVSQFVKVLEGKNLPPFEHRIVNKGGDIRWLRAIVVPRFDENGSLISYDGLLKDVTVQKIAELALIRSEQNYRTIFNSVTESIFIIDSKTGKIIDVNKEAIDLYGYCNKEEMLAENAVNLSAGIEPYNEAALTEHISKASTIGAQTFEWIARKQDGTSFWIEITIKKTEIGGEDRLLLVGRDIGERKLADQLLKDSKEKFRNLFENMNDAFALHKIITDDEGKPVDYIFLEVNSVFANRLGMKSEDLVDKRALELFPLTEQSWIEAFGKVALNGEPIEFTNYSSELDKYFETRLYCPQHGYFAGLFTDITERKRTEEKLRVNEERLRMAFEAATDAIWDWNLITNETYFSPRWYEILGYKPDEIKMNSKEWVNLAHPDDKDAVLKIIYQSMKDCSNYDVEFRSKHADGHWVWCGVKGKVTAFDSGGKAIRISGTNSDITLRKEFEQQLIESKTILQTKNEEYQALNEEYQSLNDELSKRNNMLKQLVIQLEEANQIVEGKSNLLRNITDNLPAFVASVDAITLEYKFVNEKFITGFKRKREEIIGTHISKIIGEENTAFAMKYIEEVRQGKNASYVNTFDVADGKRYFNVNYVPGFNDKGQVEDIIVLTFDISSLKATENELLIAKEKAEESDRLKTSFLQNLSHEIRTPMNAIMGFSSLLIKQYNNKSKLEYYSQIINQRCHDLLDIINDILDIAKIESGQLAVNQEECNLNLLFAELHTFFLEYQKRMDKQHINFQMAAYDVPTDFILITDKVKLKQIFINLIGNAFKFTESGTISCGSRLTSKNKIEFFVSDTGIGIPESKLNVVFERFSQLDQGSNKLNAGTGLGLSIVKGLVELLGGKIELESEVGKGSKFSFSFIYKKPEFQTTTPLKIKETINYSFSGKTILVVEDDFYNVEYLKEILSGTSFETLFVDLGGKAVEMVSNQAIDIVLMDVRLPDMSGYEATRRIRGFNREIKIIAQTAYASPEERNIALDAGCDDYISKPTDAKMLLAMISGLIG